MVSRSRDQGAKRRDCPSHVCHEWPQQSRGSAITPRSQTGCEGREERNGFTALHLAAIRGREETLKVLIDAMVKQDMLLDEPAHDGETALKSACQGTNVECVKILASAGANVDAIVNSLGRTPLMIAATTDKDQVAQVLLGAGAEVDRIHSTGMTVVEIAAFSGKLKVLQTLISGGGESRNYGP